MTDRRKLVMATNNAGKLREARAIAGDRLEILSLDDIGYRNDIEETADTLEGNALIKVRAIKEATGLDCFADDTGLLVDALGGAPGVHTARYAGEDCNPDENIRLLLNNLEGVADRRARFRTCVALSLGDEERIFEGEVEGSIATERSGTHGFGYDPVFIPDESGIRFSEMTDEAKNAISHRGRAISAMIKWLSAMCLCLLMAVSARAASSADWIIYNTFDDKIENVFDTPDKTYVLAHAQYYNEKLVDNNEKLLFLFGTDKDSGEIRPYNAQNFLSRSLIRMASYNARKNYLLIVYDDYTIDILHDDGSVDAIHALQSYSPTGTKDVRGISFDPDMDRMYLATDFGFMTLDDRKYEVVSSNIYNQPVDRAVRIADRFAILRDGKIYADDAESKHTFLTDFKEVEWGGPGVADEMIQLSSDRAVVSRTADGKTTFSIITLTPGAETPAATSIGNLAGSYITENRDGLLFARYGSLFQLDRDAAKLNGIVRREEDANLACGSWDFRNFHYAKPREGIYSLSYDGDSWTVTAQPARPDAPAVFRSTAMMYSPRHGMLANTHGIDQNFSARAAANPILLSALRDGSWTMYGLPYLDDKTSLRLVNPCGMAQDPDNPDIFYFGSTNTGMLRYDVNDPASLLHFTKSDDNPSYPGHVSVREPYASWGSAFFLTDPRFDTRGNLVVAHVNTSVSGDYKAEIWAWTPEDRKATVSPETFRPFTVLSVDGVLPGTSNLVVPMSRQGYQDMIVYVPVNKANANMAVYDHNGTLETTADDRQAEIKDLFDGDGNLSVSYIYCAVEDPSTGLVWVGCDNGVFTFDPKEQFSNPGKVSRIKVSRNDGTSLADYLLSGTPVNDISIDALGRKWFSLNGGGLVCTAADGKTIIQELTTENSMLPSDVVYASCYNPDNNSLMIATANGLCEYFLSGNSGEGSVSSVRAYPNPVRHDYYGWVTIDGLEEDCVVKIADSAGNIVRELGPATAGRVQWDVCGFDLNRVPSGVYFVLASSGSGGGSYSETAKILVINR